MSDRKVEDFSIGFNYIKKTSREALLSLRDEKNALCFDLAPRYICEEDVFTLNVNYATILGDLVASIAYLSEKIEKIELDSF